MDDTQDKLADRYLTALREKSVIMVEYLLKSGLDPNYIFTNNADLKDKTLLSLAIKKEACDIIRMLIQFKARINAIKEDEIPPLRYALMYRRVNPKMIKLLIELGANVSDIDAKYGKDGAIQLALKNSRLSTIGIIKLLVNNGADVNHIGEDGFTPVITCVSLPIRNHKNILLFLIKKQANIDAKNYHGNSVLFYPILNIDIFDFNLNNFKYGSTDLTGKKFYYEKYYKIIFLLVKFGIDIHVQNNNGYTLLHVILEKVNEILKKKELTLKEKFTIKDMCFDIFNYFINHWNYEKLDLKTKEDDTILNLGIKLELYSFVDLILKKNSPLYNFIDYNTRDNSGNTPLHNALKPIKPMFSLIEYFIRNNCDRFAKNNEGKMPIEMLSSERKRFTDEEKTILELLSKPKPVDFREFILIDSSDESEIPLINETITDDNLTKQYTDDF